MPSPASQDQPTTWTTRQLLDWTAQYLEHKHVDVPRLAAELLLGHVLETPRIKLYMDMDRPASPLERAAFRDLVEKAVDHHPVQYLLGQAFFFSLEFEVNPDVLIPRPSTETLVQHVIEHARRTPGFRNPLIVDLGTGSGAIAIALAANLTDARLIATDISEPALDVARRNAQRHGVADRIDFRLGPLFEPLAGVRAHGLVSNPPYISDAEWQQVLPNVRDYEPAHALRAGPTGTDVLSPLIAHATEYLNDPGQLVVEIAASQQQIAIDLVNQATGLTAPRVLPDHERLPRMLLADRA
ncbi:MAG: protein-(glutamine-N5) methyltransferase, release factor-specific [Planctomycetaceae bacterium]|nr:protein-(glutamine-N5) methyltransferase, release factor-specific [Planctomycetaceae bacterium]